MLTFVWRNHWICLQASGSTTSYLLGRWKGYKMYPYVLEKGRAFFEPSLKQWLKELTSPSHLERKWYHLRQEIKQFERIGVPFTSCLEETIVVITSHSLAAVWPGNGYVCPNSSIRPHPISTPYPFPLPLPLTPPPCFEGVRGRKIGRASCRERVYVLV